MLLLLDINHAIIEVSSIFYVAGNRRAGSNLLDIENQKQFKQLSLSIPGSSAVLGSDVTPGYYY